MYLPITPTALYTQWLPHNWKLNWRYFSELKVSFYLVKVTNWKVGNWDFQSSTTLMTDFFSINCIWSEFNYIDRLSCLKMVMRLNGQLCIKWPFLDSSAIYPGVFGGFLSSVCFGENNALLLLSNRTFLFHFSKSDQSLYHLQHSKLGTERGRGVKCKTKNL